jgi:hypothetical protein
MANIFAVTGRRYPIVNEEADVVLGLALFERTPGHWPIAPPAK